jgi:hypothetical protein
MQCGGDEIESVVIGEVFGHENSLYRLNTDRFRSCRVDVHPNDTGLIRQSVQWSDVRCNTYCNHSEMFKLLAP